MLNELETDCDSEYSSEVKDPENSEKDIDENKENKNYILYSFIIVCVVVIKYGHFCYAKV